MTQDDDALILTEWDIIKSKAFFISRSLASLVDVEDSGMLVANRQIFSYNLAITAVHNSLEPDFSGMVDFKIDVPMKFEYIKSRTNKKYMSQVIGIDSENIGDFVYDHFVDYKKGEELIADGLAPLLASLSPEYFSNILVETNNGKYGCICFKNLKNDELVDV